MSEQEAIDFLNLRAKHTLISHLGMIYTKWDGEVLEAELPINEKTCQGRRLLNGGASLAVAECLAGGASALICKENEHPLGMQVSANHVSSAKVGDIAIARSRSIHIGRQTHVWDVEIHSKETQKLLCTARVTNFIAKHE